MTQNKDSRIQKQSASEEDAREQDAREAWVLRAGAELWRVVVAEAGSPAEDTQKALEAVRSALDCARRLRCAGNISEAARDALEAECDKAAESQMRALQQWGRGRGLHWEKEWGTRWGETLFSEDSGHSGPTWSPAKSVTRL